MARAREVISRSRVARVRDRSRPARAREDNSWSRVARAELEMSTAGLE